MSVRKTTILLAKAAKPPPAPLFSGEDDMALLGTLLPHAEVSGKKTPTRAQSAPASQMHSPDFSVRSADYTPQSRSHKSRRRRSAQEAKRAAETVAAAAGSE